MADPPADSSDSGNFSSATQLVESDRARIRLEETYRAEIRSALGSAQTGRSRTWTFLNSNLGLWLLSAVFITGFGALYNSWQHDRDIERTRQERQTENLRITRDREARDLQARRSAIDRLDREISYRMSRTLYVLALLETRDTRYTLWQTSQHGSAYDSSKARQKLLTESLLSLTAPAGPQSPPLYADYTTYTLAALITELRHDITQPAEQKQLDRVLAELSYFTFELSHDPPALDRAILYGHRIL